MSVTTNGSIGMRSFDQSLPMALLRAREATMRRFRPMLSEFDLTEQQWRVLRALAQVDAPLDAGTLADVTFLLGPSLSRILAHLDERGLVTRSVDPADQRKVNTSLTSKGRRLVQRIAPRSEEEYEAIEAALGPQKLAELLALLSDLAATEPNP
jgi:homoprotocatechuate degradation regulator HpaR